MERRRLSKSEREGGAKVKEQVREKRERSKEQKRRKERKRKH